MSGKVSWGCKPLCVFISGGVSFGGATQCYSRLRWARGEFIHQGEALSGFAFLKENDHFIIKSPGLFLFGSRLIKGHAVSRFGASLCTVELCKLLQGPDSAVRGYQWSCCFRIGGARLRLALLLAMRGVIFTGSELR